MEVERAGAVPRAHHNMQPLTKQITPVKVTKTVSVATIFKQQPHRIKKRGVKSQPLITIPKLVVQGIKDDKAQSPKSLSSSHNAKIGAKGSRKRSDLHPLAVAFKDTSDDYRRHLYDSVTLKINKTLNTLVNSLYENALQPISSEASDTEASPVRITLPAKFEREAFKLYQPISTYQVRLTRTNNDGERVHFVGTLESRMNDYANYIAKHKVEIEKLKRDWDAIVGEIWKLGVLCLGEKTIESLLFTQETVHRLSSSPTTAESTVFVPEQGTSPSPRDARNKKHVTFAAIDAEHVLPSATTSSLEFLHQPSRLRVKPVAASPVIPEQEIENLQMQVRELGNKEIEEYRNAERAHKAYWQEMNAKLVNVLVG